MLFVHRSFFFLTQSSELKKKKKKKITKEKIICEVCRATCPSLSECTEWNEMRNAVKRGGKGSVQQNNWETLEDVRSLGRTLAAKAGAQKRLSTLLKVSQTFVSCFLRDKYIPPPRLNELLRGIDFLTGNASAMEYLQMKVATPTSDAYVPWSNGTDESNNTNNRVVAVKIHAQESSTSVASGKYTYNTKDKSERERAYMEAL